MMNYRLISLTCAALALLALLGCQGGGSLPAVEHNSFAVTDSSLTSIPAHPNLAPVHPPQAWLASGTSDDVSLPAGVARPPATRQVRQAGHVALNSALLPPLPTAESRQVNPTSRGTSATYVLGLSDLANLVDYGGGAVPLGATLTLQSAAGGLAYAVYKVDLNPNESLTAFSVTGTTSARNANYDRHGLWVGVSDYTINGWYFADQQENPPATYQNPTDLTGTTNYTWPPTGDSFIDPVSLTTYIMVGAQDGDALDITNITVFTSGGTPSILPPEWNAALSNAGLVSSDLGMRPIFGPDLSPDNFAWNTPFTDIRTILPTYWKQWYDGKETVKMPAAIRDKSDEVRITDSIQDLILSAVAEFPADQQCPAQTASATLAATDPLANAIADYVTTAGGTPDLAALIAACSAMSDANQRALARVIKAAEKTYIDRHDFLYDTLGYDDTILQTHFDGTHPYWLPSPAKASYAPVYMVDDDGAGGNWYFMRAYPRNAAFYPEACYLADAIDQFTTYLQDSIGWQNISLDVDTPAGKIVISGTGDDTHAAALPNGHLILIDLGGNDTYNCHAGATASALNGIALAIDLAGDDTYNAMDDPLNQRDPPDDETSQQGAARYGVGILVDYAGSDNYQCVRMGQGAAVMGVGVLADYDGIDSYDGEALVQGAAYGGIGICYDKGGDDDYTAWSMGQGYGGIMGVGFLIDQGTSTDFYLAQPDFDATGHPEYGSAQDALYNANFCQGAGFGKRWNGDGSVDPIVAAGGLGMLYDGGGDDDYECGIFGQAVGFFHSLGVLFDADGTDVYNGIWYVQGATAHTACAFLWEGGGMDSYWSRSSIGIGGAHDWSVTWFMERGGDDTYNGAGLSTGTGYNSGQGFFIEMDGADDYLTDNCDGTFETLGRGGWPVAGRETETSIGIFVDAGGTDQYSAEYAGMLAGTDGGNPTLVLATPPADGNAWVRINGDPVVGSGFYALGIGSGIDSGS